MMRWLKRMAGIDPAKEVTNDDLTRIVRHDRGPANAQYLRRLFPDSVFTKKITPARAKTIRAVMRRLREDQRAVVRARGWNRGIEA